jgi:hypothetical protein
MAFRYILSLVMLSQQTQSLGANDGNRLGPEQLSRFEYRDVSQASTEAGDVRW